MKKTMLALALVSFIGFTSCKKENQTKSTETVEVSEVESNPNFTVDTANSTINWTGAKPTGTHTGTLSLKEGSFEVTDGKVTGGSFIIDMNSISVTDLEGDDKAALEGHLKGTGDKDAEDHFFNVNQHPTSDFKIVSVEEANGAFFVKGVLTMKGISKPVDFPAEINVTDTGVSLISDPFKINRTTWGVNYGSKSIFDDLKDKFINDDIELVVKVKATK